MCVRVSAALRVFNATPGDKIALSLLHTHTHIFMASPIGVIHFSQRTFLTSRMFSIWRAIKMPTHSVCVFVLIWGAFYYATQTRMERRRGNENCVCVCVNALHLQGEMHKSSPRTLNARNVNAHTARRKQKRPVGRHKIRPGRAEVFTCSRALRSVRGFRQKCAGTRAAHAFWNRNESARTDIYLAHLGRTG